MYQVTKPIQCSKCGSRNIVKPLNQFDNLYSETKGVVELRCLNCGHEKISIATTKSTGDIGHGYSYAWVKVNEKNYEEF